MVWTSAFVCKAECHRLCVYSLKWKKTMYHRHSSRPAKASKKSKEGNPSSDEENILRKLRGKRRGTAIRKSRDGDGTVNTYRRGRGFKDFIDSIREPEPVVEEDKGNFVVVADKGVDDSDEECGSVNSSIASGPSLSFHSTSSQVRCSACWKLYQKARRMKAPIKNKLLDNDPNSPTSDQWVLIKKWRPRRLPNASGKLVILTQLLNNRPKITKGVKQSQHHFEESSSCSRPHIFLQRNLRHRVKVPLKQQLKKNTRGKRARNKSQDSQAAKQPRLHSNPHIKRLSPTCNRRVSSQRRRSGLGDCSAEEIHKADRCPTVDWVPTTVTMETSGSGKVSPKQKTSKKKNGFRDLLAQLRSNSSMIIKETR